MDRSLLTNLLYVIYWIQKINHVYILSWSNLSQSSFWKDDDSCSGKHYSVHDPRSYLMKNYCYSYLHYDYSKWNHIQNSHQSNPIHSPPLPKANHLKNYRQKLSTLIHFHFQIIIIIILLYGSILIDIHCRY